MLIISNKECKRVNVSLKLLHEMTENTAILCTQTSCPCFKIYYLDFSHVSKCIYFHCLAAKQQPSHVGTHESINETQNL